MAIKGSWLEEIEQMVTQGGTVPPKLAIGGGS